MSSALPFVRPQKFIAVWSGDDNPSIILSGDQFVLPKHDEVALAFDDRGRPTGSIFRVNAARDEQGKPMPGTLVLEDLVKRGEAGEIVKTFDARAAIIMFAQNDSRAPNGGILKRGLSFVETPAEVRQVQAEGRPRWVEGKRAEWVAEVQAERNRRQLWREKHPGEEPPPSSSDAAVKLAAESLKRYAAEAAKPSVSDDELLGALMGTPSAPVAQVTDDERGYGLLVYDEAKRLGVKVSRDLALGVLDGEASSIKKLEDMVATAKAPQEITA